MRKFALLILLTTPLFAAPRWQIQSNPWVNLHQRLLNEVRFNTPSPSTLNAAETSTWKKQVEVYRAFVAKKNPLFNQELMDLNLALSGLKGTRLPKTVPAPAAAVLAELMPLYKRTLWPEDDRANKFWIALAQPMLAEAGEELVAAHEKVYGVPFPKRIIVDVSAEAGQFGAYTTGEGEFAHAVISPHDPGTQGFGALESLLHEPSHSIVDAESGAVGADLTRLAREMNVKPRYNLWHAILFYTSGELTRRALAKRGITTFKPMAEAMFELQFQGMKDSIVKNWGAVLDGTMSREDALRRILEETKAEARP